jgi:uncharacterized protein YggE
VTDERLTVLGRATGGLEPDRVEWSLLVREEDADPRAAFARCSERLRELTERLAQAELTTGAVTVREHTERGEHGVRVPTGRHAASAALTATAPLELGGEVAAAAIDAGADELRGPYVRFPDPAPLVDDLLAEAVHTARRSAERMAAAAGRALGRVLSVSDGRIESDWEFSSEAQAMSRRSGGDSLDSEPPPVIPRPQRLFIAVTVVFALVD